MFVPPKNVLKNNIPYDAGHFIRTEIDLTDLKKSNKNKRKRDKKSTVYCPNC